MLVLEPFIAELPPLKTDENGVVRVRGTRVTLDTVVGAYENGCSAEEIALKYPTLDLTDVYAVITYYLRHREEVESYLAERRREAAEIRRRIEARSPQKGIRERLMARRDGKT